MIGRSESIQLLNGYIEKSQSGKLQVVFISGPSGIGKSTLVQEALRHAPACYPISFHYFESTAAPYAPFVHALRLMISQYELPLDNLSMSAYLTILLPEMNTVPAAPDKVKLTDSIREVFQTVAHLKPLCLVLEDCHWADTATLELLPGLLEGLYNLPIILLITYRNDSIPRDHPIARLRTQLRRQPVCHELNLTPLSQEETGQLIAEQLKQSPSPALVERIYIQTQGLPFFVKELTNALNSKALMIPSDQGLTLERKDSIPIPDTIRDMIALQLDGITKETREALELAALIGQEFDLELLSDILGNDQAIDDLFTISFLVLKDARTGAFSHALVREVIKQDIVWSKRKQLNWQVAAALEARQAPAELVGQYWLEGGEKGRARLAFVEASRLYCRIDAHADAARTARQALEIWPKGSDEPLRLEVLQRLAQCTRVSGQVHHSILSLREMLESPMIGENQQKLGETYRALAISYALQGTWQHYKQCRKQAAESHEKAGLWAEATLDWHELANRCIDDLDMHAALEAVTRAIHCAMQTDKTDLQAKALSVKGYILAIQGKSKEGGQIVQEAISLALAHNHVEASAYAYRKLAGALEFSSDFTGSIQAYESALNYCRQENLDEQGHFCMTCMSGILFRIGDWKRSLEVCNEYLEASAVNDSSKALGHLIIGLIRVFRGETKTATQYIQDAYTLSNQANFRLIDSILYWGMATLQEYDNQPDKAYQHYCQLLTYWEKSHEVHDILPGLCSAISFFLDHQHREESNQTIQILSAIANETGNAEAVGVLSFALGEMARHQHKYREANEHYTHAIRTFTELAIPLQLIAVLVRKAKSHLAMGEKQEAVELLQQAQQTARPLSVRPILSTITALLEQASDKGHHTGKAVVIPAPHAGLTERQLEILQTLVEGLSNKEIAARLHLSTRTVDMHIRHLYDRLNCRTRAEAVRLALEKRIVSQPIS